jgi:hypothetical protein
LLGLAATIVLLPETRGKSLEDIAKVESLAA